MAEEQTRSIKTKDYPEVTTIIGEDSGGWSRTKEKPMSLSIALCRTVKPNEFAEIATHYEWNTKHPKCDDKELKFRSSSDAVRKAVLTEIASLDPEIYISTDERKGIDTGHPKRYKDLFRKVAEYILNDTEEPDEEFFMDGSSFMKPKSGEDIVKTAVKIKGIRYHHAESVNELIVQTQDFIAGAANASRKGNDAYIDIIKGSIIFWRID